eukprot:1088225-Alexandrium_andersonii.AAC.1
MRTRLRDDGALQSPRVADRPLIERRHYAKTKRGDHLQGLRAASQQRAGDGLRQLLDSEDGAGNVAERPQPK